MTRDIQYTKPDPSWLNDMNYLRQKMTDSLNEVLGEYILSQNEALSTEKANLILSNSSDGDAPELTRVINIIQLSLIYAAVTSMAKTASFFDLGDNEKKVAKIAMKSNLADILDESFDDIVRQYDKMSPTAKLFKELIKTAGEELARRKEKAKEGRY